MRILRVLKIVYGGDSRVNICTKLFIYCNTINHFSVIPLIVFIQRLLKAWNYRDSRYCSPTRAISETRAASISSIATGIYRLHCDRREPGYEKETQETKGATINGPSMQNANIRNECFQNGNRIRKEK